MTCKTISIEKTFTRVSTEEKVEWKEVRECESQALYLKIKFADLWLVFACICMGVVKNAQRLNSLHAVGLYNYVTII